MKKNKYILAFLCATAGLSTAQIHAQSTDLNPSSFGSGVSYNSFSDRVELGGELLKETLINLAGNNLILGGAGKFIIERADDVFMQIKRSNAGGAAQIQLTRGDKSTYIGPSPHGIDFYSQEDLPFNFANNGLFRMMISSAGNVGIGIRNPENKLEVDGTTKSKNLILSNLSTESVTYNPESGRTYLTIDSDGIVKKVSESDTRTGSSAQTAETLYSHNGSLQSERTIQTNNNNLLLVGGGKFGIGTTAPVHPLSVVSDEAALIGIKTNNPNKTSQINFSRGDKETYFGPSPYGIDFYSRENLPFNFANNGILRMTITENGNVGVGTAQPTAKMDVQGTVKAHMLCIEEVCISKQDLQRIINKNQ